MVEQAGERVDPELTALTCYALRVRSWDTVE